MEKVLGIGGLFFRAKDPQALAAWYEKYLGITPVPTDYDQPVWTSEAGVTVFSPFAESTEYFGDRSNQWMVNFRVRNLDAMVAQLRAAGSKVVVDEQEYPNGRFARTHDPEGHPIELWEPKELK
jgi:predicted enzyme related to lactoylglutathione lyase